MTRPESPAVHVRRTLRVAGQVQGVGFRPFVYRLAHDLGLTGNVRNDPGGVTIEAQGTTGALDAFVNRLSRDAPTLAQVGSVSCTGEDPAVAGETEFSILASDAEPARRGRVTVDAAVCPDCLREMHDPANRRHHHALVNCTNCGPRYTIVCDLPYDRPLTTMAPFAMCPDCEAEYRDPGDRRFHAQPTCCPACGPQLRLVSPEGETSEGDAIRGAAAVLRRGHVLAVKGLGGYHLAALASDAGAARRLREAKGRDHKPFALMVAGLEDTRALVELSPAAEERMLGPERPIVLARRRPDIGIAKAVAPDSHRLGVMLPYTPLQHLLFAEGLGPLVMTSANHANDPLLKDDEEILAVLGALCDAALVHDRGIERAVDDSIVLDAARGPTLLRRARGHVPAPLPLPLPAPRPGLCTGGDLKSAIAVVSGEDAVLSQHLGDLDYTLAWQRFLATCTDLQRLFDVNAAWIACDAHPGYRSHRHAIALARANDLELIEVQHHHAHLASVMAEHGRTAGTIGIVCDGVGYGGDGEAWGGEVLVADLLDYERVGRLRPLRLPGGDAAARETGRCALSWMWDLLGEDAVHHPLAGHVVPDAERLRTVADLLARDQRCPPSSGLGRLFDAAAALLGVCSYNHHEAMSGLGLEAQASRAKEHERTCGDGVIDLAPSAEEDAPFEMDTRPLLQALLDRISTRRPTPETAWFFHDALADGLYRAAATAAARAGIQTIALSGGVFCNALLVDRLVMRLERDGYEVLTHSAIPPNDGGLAYGQAAVAAARLGAVQELPATGRAP